MTLITRSFWIINAIALSVPINAQTQLPYYSGFDNAGETQGWTQYRRASTISSSWAVGTQQPLSGTSCLLHYYPVGEPTVDWYVSPPFQFPNGGTIDSLSFAFTGFSSQPGNDDSVYVYVLRGSADPSQATAMSPLLAFKGANYVNDNTWRDTAGIFIPGWTASSSYIAFKYKSENSWLDVRFDNLRISGNLLAPQASFTVSSKTVCIGDAVSFTDLTTNSPISWNWDFEGATPPTSTQQNPVVTYTAAGTFNVILTAGNSAGQDIASVPNYITVVPCVGLDETGNGSFSLYPNPVSGFLTIAADLDGIYEITDLTGRCLDRGTCAAGRAKRVSTGAWEQGVYIATLKAAKRTYSIKVVKE